jgi:hypothetical protein
MNRRIQSDNGDKLAASALVGATDTVNANEKSKYSKHNRQQRHRCWSLIGMLASFIMLVYLVWTLQQRHRRIHSQELVQSMDRAQQIRGHQHGNKRPQEQPAQLLRGGEGGGDNAGGGFFGGIPNMNSNTALAKELDALDNAMMTNRHSGILWMRPQLLPSRDPWNHPNPLAGRPMRKPKISRHGPHFQVSRSSITNQMAWKQNVLQEEENKSNNNSSKQKQRVDYTLDSLYSYPALLMEPPATLGDYPPLQSMQQLMDTWPQDQLDHPSTTPPNIQEVLFHFDYTHPDQVDAARKFRDAKLPFKLTNVPELLAAGNKWTDEYVAEQFNSHQASGSCQESSTNFFAFFTPSSWDVETMGLPPTRNNDWTFDQWSQHARYADESQLDFDQPHFYWQSGVPKEERTDTPKDKWSFVSKDLPSLSSPTETFFVFHPKEQKGIQCRFGERGVTAATHYDGGRNMVAMVTGAKRYILSPPRECSKLGIVAARGNTIFRHSLMNFGHLNYMDKEEMPPEERAWLERAGQAQALSTVLKAGEVLFIPSHWFHYIVSLQKSAQCNVRSGVDDEGDTVFGGQADVLEKCQAVF